MIKKIYAEINTLLRYTWSLFLNGLLILLPISLTIILIRFLLCMVVGWLSPLTTVLDQTMFEHVPYGEVLLAVIFVMLVGLLMKSFVLQSLIDVLEHCIARVPLVRPVYHGLKQLVYAFAGQDQSSFKTAVLVEFPRKGAYSIGFLTGELFSPVKPEHLNELCTVFIPTTPNPTGGFLIAVPRSDITILDISRQDAIALILSGGIIQPAAK